MERARERKSRKKRQPDIHSAEKQTEQGKRVIL